MALDCTPAPCVGVGVIVFDWGMDVVEKRAWRGRMLEGSEGLRVRGWSMTNSRVG